jgi:DNA-binding NtrC family response regulator
MKMHWDILVVDDEEVMRESLAAWLHEIFQLIQEIASLRSTMLIQGENGTGKELIARDPLLRRSGQQTIHRRVMRGACRNLAGVGIVWA